jgi:ACT domain-containing protein
MKQFFLLFAVTISATSFAQLNFQKNQKLEVVTETKRTSSMELMGQSMESTVNSTMTTVYDVKDVSATGSTLEHKVKRLVFNANAMGQSQSFDSEKQEDMNGEMGKMLEKSIKNKYTVSLDPRGKVSAVKTDDTNGNKDETMMAQIISSQLGLNLAGPKVGTPSPFFILPNRSLKQGETWTDTISMEGEKRILTYTVSSITDATINLDYNEETNVDTKMEIMGTQADLKSKSKGKGSITVDKKTGILKTMTVVSDVEGNIEAQGQTIPNKDKVNTTITVKMT